MKGGKGGVGRKRNSPTKAAENAAPRDFVKKGAAKKDWGAMPTDDFDGPPKIGGKLPVEPTAKPTAKPAPTTKSGNKPSATTKPGGRRR